MDEGIKTHEYSFKSGISTYLKCEVEFDESAIIEIAKNISFPKDSFSFTML
jgi:hypothetical protein